MWRLVGMWMEVIKMDISVVLRWLLPIGRALLIWGRSFEMVEEREWLSQLGRTRSLASYFP